MERTPNCKCLLCLKEKSTKKNSHIIPRFVVKTIFANSPQRKAFIWDTSSLQNKPEPCQDSAKEDYILCPSCEKYFEILETYVSEFLHKRILNKKFRDNFSFDSLEQINFVRCLKLNPLISKLFFISIFWRCSITKRKPFNVFYIDEEESLRAQLLKFKVNKIHELLNLKSIEFKDENEIIVIKSTNLLEQSKNIIYAQKAQTQDYGIVMNEYIVYLLLDETPISNKFEKFKNNYKEEFKVILANDNIWTELKNVIIEDLITDKIKKINER